MEEEPQFDLAETKPAEAAAIEAYDLRELLIEHYFKPNPDDEWDFLKQRQKKQYDALGLLPQKVWKTIEEWELEFAKWKKDPESWLETYRKSHPVKPFVSFSKTPGIIDMVMERTLELFREAGTAKFSKSVTRSKK
jgi:hypothetical protein